MRKIYTAYKLYRLTGSKSEYLKKYNEINSVEISTHNVGTTSIISDVSLSVLSVRVRKQYMNAVARFTWGVILLFCFSNKILNKKVFKSTYQNAITYVNLLCQYAVGVQFHFY